MAIYMYTYFLVFDDLGDGVEGGSVRAGPLTSVLLESYKYHASLLTISHDIPCHASGCCDVRLCEGPQS